MILQVDGKLKKIAVRELLPFSYGVEGQVIAWDRAGGTVVKQY